MPAARFAFLTGTACTGGSGPSVVCARAHPPPLRSSTRVCGRPRSLLRPPHRRTRGVVTAEMYVPNDSFGGVSPERKAADALRQLFTFIAVRIVLAQMAGSGRGDLGAYGGGDYVQLRDYLLENPVTKDGDEWCKGLMRQNKALGACPNPSRRRKGSGLILSGPAMRVLEVRAAYVSEEFEWDNCRRLAVEHMQHANVTIMRDVLDEAFKQDSMDDDDAPRD